MVQSTRAVLRAEAASASGRDVSLPARLIDQFHDFQRWLAAQPSNVVIVPFAAILAEKIPAGEVRMRRDFKQLLAVIKAIALLNQQHRERDASGRIVANLDDYRWARSLLLAIFKSIVGGGVTDAIRQTVAALPEEGDGLSETDLVRALDLSKSTVHYRVTRALRGGWIQNLEKRRGFPFRLVRGAPLPEDSSPLPTVEALESEIGAFEPFEHPPCSNTYSNTPKTLGGVDETEGVFECSNENEPTSPAENKEGDPSNGGIAPDCEISATEEAEIDPEERF